MSIRSLFLDALYPRRLTCTCAAGRPAWPHPGRAHTFARIAWQSCSPFPLPPKRSAIWTGSRPGCSITTRLPN